METERLNVLDYQQFDESPRMGGVAGYLLTLFRGVCGIEQMNAHDLILGILAE